eukprot:TRINITY_DN251_c0_g1_i2.p1 TRINITY_DN251_c0_g1~~TRINITY_DN251_c0_g1_i2.p1  ORF type:complete len:848 (-),score=351.01 TRINITY_DN251_c0_g1_i2:687-2867(-)
MYYYNEKTEETTWTLPDGAKFKSADEEGNEESADKDETPEVVVEEPVEVEEDKVEEIEKEIEKVEITEKEEKEEEKEEEKPEEKVEEEEPKPVEEKKITQPKLPKLPRAKRPEVNTAKAAEKEEEEEEEVETEKEEKKEKEKKTSPTNASKAKKGKKGIKKRTTKKKAATSDKPATTKGRFDRLRKFGEKKDQEKVEEEQAKQSEEVHKKEMFDQQVRELICLGMIEKYIPDAKPQDLEEYGTEYFNLNRKGFFGKKTKVSKMLAWKLDVIRKPMCSLPKDMSATAVQCFRNITGFMGDRNTSKEGGGHAYKLLKNCLHAPQELKDEVYCQLLKQTNCNPNVNSLLKGLQLFSVLSGAFAASEDLRPYLMWHLRTLADEHEDSRVNTFAKHVMMRLEKAVALGDRRETPTTIEVEASKDLRPVTIMVHFLNGDHIYVPVESWNTAKEVKEIVAAKVGVLDNSPFALFEMNQNGEERVLDNDERIMDLVAYWQRVFDEGKDKDKKKAPDRFKLVFKVYMYFNLNDEDISGNTFLYQQAVHDVVTSRYPCNEKDCYTLAALQLQAETGDSPNSRSADYITPELLSKCLPEKLQDSERAMEVTMQIMRYHTKLKGIDKNEAQQSYLDYVKQWKIYGSSFFFVEPQMSTEFPDEVFLAVNPSGILIINPETKETLATYPYSELPTWGHSASSFVLHVGNLLQQSKLYFKTEQGKDINELIHAYVEHLCQA